jgi:ribosome small subunit-dependent GTPase A
LIGSAFFVGSGLDRVKELLIPRKTFCLIGSSGVGKTTLLNHLMGGALFETQTVREKDGKGKHTTNRRHLVNLKNGVLVIDTPGMRELGNIAVESSLYGTFNQIQKSTSFGRGSLLRPLMNISVTLNKSYIDMKNLIPKPTP